MNNEKWILAGVAALVLFQVLSFFNLGSSFGVGTPFVEDYDPFIKTYGINTEKDITTTGTITGVAAAFSGASSLTSTLAVTSTSTLSDTVNFNNPGLCINVYATSTATRGHLVASTTATIEGVDGVMLFEYGACAL